VAAVAATLSVSALPTLSKRKLVTLVFFLIQGLTFARLAETKGRASQPLQGVKSQAHVLRFYEFKF
jgi:hypothetical protein